jgi:hypothetical protein
MRQIIGILIKKDTRVTVFIKSIKFIELKNYLFTQANDYINKE